MKPPAEARTRFGEQLPLAERYAEWLAGAGVERGLLGPREVDRLWTRHLLNCAVLEPFIPPGTERLCDLGSGAGLPGLVLAILRPEVDVVLLEPLLRRSVFLQEVVDDLELPRVTVVRQRAEDYRRTAPDHDVVTARAVAPLERLAGWALPLVRPGGMLLALKGESAAAEVEAAGRLDARLHTVTEGDSVTRVVQIVRGDDR